MSFPLLYQKPIEWDFMPHRIRVGNFSTSSADYRTYPLDANFSHLHNYSYRGITMQTGTMTAAVSHPAAAA
jgi:hypothetical protein